MSYNKPIYIDGTKSYSDIDLDFISHPITKNLSKKTNDDAIKQSVKVLLFTHFGEKPFDHTFGSRLNNSLFENMNRFIEDELDFEVRRVLGTYEPRIAIIDVIISALPDENELNLRLNYVIVSTAEPVTINILLKRSR